MYAEPTAEDNAILTGGDFQFSEKTIRLGFIRKVYGILLCQLIVTISLMCIFIFVEEVKNYSIQNPWLWGVSLGVVFVSLIVMACCANVRRQFPMNMIFLSIFTVAEGVLLGTVSSHYKTESVLIAAGITALVALALTIFAFQTKWDFTMMGGMLFVLLIVLLVFGFLCIFLHSRILDLVYAALGALLFSFYLVFDTQMMMGGKHKYALSPEEYIFAALNLYLDIVNLFMFILALTGGRD